MTSTVEEGNERVSLEMAETRLLLRDADDQVPNPERKMDEKVEKDYLDVATQPGGKEDVQSCKEDVGITEGVTGEDGVYAVSLAMAEDVTQDCYSCQDCYDILERSFKVEHFDDHPSLDVSLPLAASRRSLCSSRASLPQSTARTGLRASRCNLTLDLECRICHDTEGQDMISPCHCAGTSKWVHESCIIRWIKHAKAKECEICTCPIKVKKRKKPIEQWTRPSASCGPCNKLDIWYCFVVILCVFIIIGFVVLQHRYDVTEQIETTVIFASIYVLCGMIIMMKARYFWTWFTQRSRFWGNWKNLNEEWRIVEATEANTPVSPV